MPTLIERFMVEVNPGYERIVSARGPAGYWQMNETSGTAAADASGHGRTGTFTGSYTLNQPPVISTGRSVSINGGRVSLPDLGISGISEYTMEAWFEGDGSWDANHEIIFETGSTGHYLTVFGGKGGVSLRVSGTQYIAGMFAGGPTIPSTGRQHLVATWRTGEPLRLYHNGEFAVESMAPVSGTLDAATQGSIGAWTDGTLSFTGNIDEAAVYHRVLTGQEIREHYEAGLGWVDISADVVLTSVRWRRGNDGTGPFDRVAQVGTLSFALRNDELNSARLAGYYSPGHANARVAFRKKMPVRFSILYDSSAYTQFVGWMNAMQPTAGSRGARLTFCDVTDWLEEAATTPVTGISTQVNKRHDEIIAALVALVPTQPTATDYETGVDTFPFAVDQPTETDMVLEEMTHAVVSELGHGYVLKDGTLRIESRHTRSLAPATTSIDGGDMDGIDARSDLAVDFNQVAVQIEPRRVDAAATTVLYSHDGVPQLGIGETLVIDAQYVDPTNEAKDVGGKDMQTFTATTDYTANDAADGSGTNRTAGIVTTGTFLGSRAARFVINNNSGVSCYLTKLQCRGRGLYNYTPLELIENDTDSQADIGIRRVSGVLPYQGNAVVGQAMAVYVLDSLAPTGLLVTRLGVQPNASVTLMEKVLALDIGSRVAPAEAQTGTQGAFYIGAISGEITGPRSWREDWVVSPGEVEMVWVLGETGASELDDTTILGFV